MGTERGRKSSPQPCASTQSPEQCQEPARRSCSSHRARRDPAEPSQEVAARGPQPCKKLSENPKRRAGPPPGSSQHAAARSSSHLGAVVLSDEALTTSCREAESRRGQPGGDGGGNVHARRGPAPPSHPVPNPQSVWFSFLVFFFFFFLKNRLS